MLQLTMAELEPVLTLSTMLPSRLNSTCIGVTVVGPAPAALRSRLSSKKAMAVAFALAVELACARNEPVARLELANAEAENPVPMLFELFVAEVAAPVSVPGASTVPA